MIEKNDYLVNRHISSRTELNMKLLLLVFILPIMALGFLIPRELYLLALERVNQDKIGTQSEPQEWKEPDQIMY